MTEFTNSNDSDNMYKKKHDLRLQKSNNKNLVKKKARIIIEYCYL
jgi:hypothetical protein